MKIADSLEAESVVPCRSTVSAPPRRFSYRAGLSIAAVLGVVCLGGPRWLMSQDAEPVATLYSTEVGANRSVSLGDGSRMHLNTSTKVRVRYTKKSRLIVLERGEVFVSIAADARRPFLLTIDRITLVSNSAAFTVRLHENPPEVLQITAVKGNIEVWQQPFAGHTAPPAKGPIQLTAGQRASFHSGDSITVQPLSAADLMRSTLWLQGQVAFQGEPLHVVAREMSRYHTRKLLILDTGIANVSVGGTFRTSDLDGFANTLVRTFNLRRLPAVSGTGDIQLVRTAAAR